MCFKNIFFTIIVLFLFLGGRKIQAKTPDSLILATSGKSLLRTGVFYGAVFASIGGLYLFADEAYYNDAVVPFHWARTSDGGLDWFDNYHRGIDKFGHVYSTSLFSQNLYGIARWAGYDKTKASWLSAGSALTILTAMEVWDGNFKSWGFSPGDFTANVFGALFPVTQRHIGFMQHVDYKMSYRLFADKEKDAGVHDYAHMTFWLTANPAGLFKQFRWLQRVRFLNIAAGYGITPGFQHKQELYLALDYNLKQIKIKNTYVKHILEILDRFHLPAPAVRFRPGGTTFMLFF